MRISDWSSDVCSSDLFVLKGSLTMELEAAKMLGAGLAVIGVIGSGIGIGSIFSSFIVAVGRNPAARGEVFTLTMLGFALVEAIALFALVIALRLLFGYAPGRGGSAGGNPKIGRASGRERVGQY